MNKLQAKRKMWLVVDLAVVLVAAVIAVLLVPQLTHGRVEPVVRRTPGGYLLTSNLVYATVDGKQLQLDMLQPVGTAVQPRPVAVFIHGGAWRSGDKSGGMAYLSQLVRAGYLCCSINYRLSSQAAFPAQIHDCKAAIRWIRTHAAEYGGDPECIAVFGTSAGGHLAALLALSGGVAELEGEVGDCLDASSAVQVVADWFGPSDFRMMQQADMSEWHRGVLEQFFGRPLEDCGDLLAVASPVVHVDRQDPPVLIVHGTADETVWVGQSRWLHQALQAAQVTVEYHEVKDGGHGRFRTTDPDLRELIGAMVAFFDVHLAASAPAGQP